jgi:DNA-binding MarR family transcriptional regulator
MKTENQSVGCSGGNWKNEGDLSAGAHQAWGALLRSHAYFVERIERKVSAQGGLSLEAYDVLLMLSYAPGGRLRMGELYEAVTLSRSGLTRLVDRLEKEGWVTREVCPHDRRSFEAILTPAGEAARAKCWPFYAQAIAEEFGHFWSEEEAHTLAALLERPLKTETTPPIREAE